MLTLGGWYIPDTARGDSKKITTKEIILALVRADSLIVSVGRVGDQDQWSHPCRTSYHALALMPTQLYRVTLSCALSDT